MTANAVTHQTVCVYMCMHGGGREGGGQTGRRNSELNNKQDL